ncbi:MAG TPA: hypothetical protein VGE21_00255 [Flavobacteriales bacterium]
MLLATFSLGFGPLAKACIVPDTIPFARTEYNNIIVPVVLNGQDTVRLMFHSAFTGIALTREGLQRCTSIRIDGEGTAESWAGSASSSVSLHNMIRIGRQTWDSVMVTIDEQSGPGSDGKFGYDLFADRVLEIDHDRQVMVVHPDPPDASAGYTPIPLIASEGSLYIAASIMMKDSVHTDRFMLHTGYGGTAILGTAFRARLGADVTLDTLGVKKLTDSFGNVLRNVTTRTPAITIGDQVFRDVRIQVMDPRSRFAANVLGGDLLKRFNCVIDLRNKRLSLKPNGLLNASFSERF